MKLPRGGYDNKDGGSNYQLSYRKGGYENYTAHDDANTSYRKVARLGSSLH